MGEKGGGEGRGGGRGDEGGVGGWIGGREVEVGAERGNECYYLLVSP